MNTCGKCFCWKQKSDEPEMGYCLKATKGRKHPKREGIKPVKTGIAIRQDYFTEIEVLFGSEFGCIHFE